MRQNLSPWLYQLDPERPRTPLSQDIETDIVIVGAGIAGVASAFAILEKTEESVALIESHRLGHGATGHNAGQIVAYFERGLRSLVEEFGLDKAIQGQRDVENAWSILEHMYKTAKLSIPFFSFMGRTGFTSTDQILLRLENNRLRVQGGLEAHPVFVSESSGTAEAIPSEYDGAYTLLPRAKILEMLETEREDFVGLMTFRKGTINSALFCEEIVKYLARTYPKRFTLYEHTPVKKVVLRHDEALLDTEKHTVRAKRVVLCTNGFENIRIFNETGLDIDAKYHHLVTGKRGYMSGYLERQNKEPIAISYFTEPGTSPDNSYFYLTRRPFEYKQTGKYNLICVGGPDVSFDDTTTYSPEEAYPEEYAEEIDRFIKSTYDIDPNRKVDYIFTWHGLMGYTRHGVRMAGPEPKNPVLLYNIGCNGVGILTSLCGADKVARHIRGDTVEPSIFDVPIIKRPAPAPSADSPEPAGDYIAAFLDWFGSRR